MQLEEGALAKVSDPWDSLHMAQQKCRIVQQCTDCIQKRLKRSPIRLGLGSNSEGIDNPLRNPTHEVWQESRKSASCLTRPLEIIMGSRRWQRRCGPRRESSHPSSCSSSVASEPLPPFPPLPNYSRLHLQSLLQLCFPPLRLFVLSAPETSPDSSPFSTLATT